MPQDIHEPTRHVKLVQEPLFLLITQNKHVKQCKLVENEEEAIAAAREFVGTHNPVDGCSTEAHGESRGGAYGSSFYISRESSFGRRYAQVLPVGTDFQTELR